MSDVTSFKDILAIPEGLHNNNHNQRLIGQSSKLSGPYSSMGYANEFQLLGTNQPKENAATSAKVNGAKTIVAVQNQHPNNTPKPRHNAMSKWAKDAHKRVARTVGYALTVGGFDSWHGLSKVFEARLTPSEIGGIAYAAMRALGGDLSKEVFNATHGGVGSPIAPLFNQMDEAAFWADMAEPDALDAYCLASFNRMAPDRKAAFLGFVQGRRAA